MKLHAYQRLFLSYLVLIVGLVVALLIGAEGVLRRSLVERVRYDLQREVELGEALRLASPELDADSLADLLGNLSQRRVTIVAADGTVLGESTYDGTALAALDNHADRPEIRAAMDSGSGVDVRASGTLGVDQLYFALRTGDGGAIRMAVSMEDVNAPIRQLQRSVVAVGGLAIALAALFSLGFSVAVTRPLRRIQAAARRMSGGDFSIRLREHRTDEFGMVANTLDAMAEQLEGRVGELVEEQNRMRVLIDTMSEGVIALRPDGVIQLANPAAHRMFALPVRLPLSSPEEISRRGDFLRIVKQAMDGESIPLTELVGEGRSLLATAQPLPEGGAVIVLLDITELRRLEGVRRDFVANASHELKTPLTAIRGYSETLLDPDLSPELVRRFATVVHSNADRLQRIVDDLLDLSRIETGGWVVYPEDVELRPLVQEVWDAMMRTRDPKQIDFGVIVSRGAERARCDPAAVRQILTNLLSNAVRYTPEGGQVTVTVERADDLPAKDGRPWLRLEVSDSGSGIPSVHLQRIFERFYRVDPARSREEGGTGLGLAIVKHLVEAHGGSVKAESLIGHGATIRFTLPVAGGGAAGGERVTG